MKNHKLIVFISIYLIYLILTGCSLENIAARQDKATKLLPELTDGVTYGQSFTSDQDMLYRIDLGTATYARTDNRKVIFHLLTDLTSKVDIFSATIPGSEVQNDRPTTVTFPPIPNSKGKTFYIYVESPGAITANANSIYINQHDDYPSGTAYQNGGPVQGDLVFTAYSRQTFTLNQIINTISLRIITDKPFFAFYLLLVVAISVVLVLLLAKGRSRPV